MNKIHVILLSLLLFICNVCIAQNDDKTYQEYKANQYASYGTKLYDTKFDIGVGTAVIMGIGDANPVSGRDIDVPAYIEGRYTIADRFRIVGHIGFESFTYTLHLRGQLEYYIKKNLSVYVSAIKMHSPNILIGVCLII